MTVIDSCPQGNILVVDDRVENLRVLVDTLSAQGYRVRAVRSGPMALLAVKATPPDVILLDIRMPDMDGYEVCQRLKIDPITQAIPVIFLSAVDEVIDKNRAFAVGGVDYITKPFQMVEVQARVQHQITIQALKRQVAAQQQQLATILAAQREQATDQTQTPDLSPNFSPNLASPALDSKTESVAAAVRAILDGTQHLGQTTDISPDYVLHLHTIRRHSWNILTLLGEEG